MEAVSIPQLANKIATEADAYLYLEGLRWPDGPVCPHCGNEKAYYLNPRSESGQRKTRTGSGTQRRLWKCAACRKQFSVLTDTIFHGSKIPVRTWLFVVFEMCSSKNGVAAREIERKYGLTNKTAWFMLHRIREAMKRGPLVGMLRGHVTADETYFGGREKNKHKAIRNPGVTPTDEPTPIVPGGRVKRSKGPAYGKTAVVSLVDQRSGEVRSQVIPDVTGASLRKVIAEQVDMAATTLYTDEAQAYRTFSHELADHRTVNHSQDEYVRYEDGLMVTSNHAEGYFSQLKRSIDGTQHHVSVQHLPRYLAEFDFRYSTRKDTDTARMQRLMGQAGGKRLTYKRTVG